MRKRLLALAMALVLLLSAMPMNARAADAVSMMVSYAQARVDKTGQELGYNDQWCAFFVCDCAIYAGQSNAIPYNGNAHYLYFDVLDAGGKVVQSPQAGDLIFYNCTACDTNGDGISMMHVGLVENSSYSIEGNLDGSSFSTRTVKRKGLNERYSHGSEHSTDNYIKRVYVRPAYSGLTSLEKPVVSTTNTSFSEGSNIKISWNAVSGNEWYWINVYKDGILIVDQSMGASTSYTLNNAEYGKYKIQVSANNSSAHSGSGICEFSVAKKSLDKPSITMESTNYYEAEDISISWTAVDGNEWYWINVYKDDVLVVNQSTGTTTSYTIEDAEPGTYTIKVSANNSVCHSGSASCQFTVADVQAEINAWVSDEKMGDQTDTYSVGNWYYYCYNITDAVSGKLLDSIQENSYTVTMTNYFPDGTAGKTYEYNNDNNWISVQVTAPGTYKCKLEISGAFSFSEEFGFTVADPCESGHSWDGGKVTTAATEKAEGVKTYTCTVCGEAKTESIPKLGHSYTEKVTAPTCTEQGYTTYTCACGDSYKDTYVDALGHDMGGWEVAGAATCTEYGKEYNRCSRCDHVESRAIEPLGHDWKDWETKVEATCTEDGKESRRCTRCTTTEFDVISKLGHSWDEGTVTKAPEEGVEGEKTYTCTRIGCGETKTEIIPPLDHTHKYSETVTAPSCTEKGYTTHTCTCGDSYVDGETDALGHSWDDGKVTKEPTEETGGEKTYTCTTCQDTRTEGIPPLDHTHKYSDTVTAPTCTKQGYTTHTCPCGDSYIDSETDALGHSWDNGKCSTCGIADPDWSEPDKEGQVIRLAGDSRFDTALAVADQLKEELGVDGFDAVIVASGTNFADALSGSYLAAVKNAPILLSCNDDFNPKYVEKYNGMVVEYVRDNLRTDGTVYILGGPKAVTTSLDEALSGYNVKRLAGANRYETNIRILEEAGVDGKDVLICNGEGFADSLSASATELPILLVNSKYGVFDVQRSFLDGVSEDFYVIGGESAVSVAVEEDIRGYGNVTRIGGKDRFETSVLIAETFFEEPEAAVLAYAWNFPDGLCGGPLAAAMDAPLILTMTKRETAAAEYVQGMGIRNGAILGGTGLISDGTVNSIFG